MSRYFVVLSSSIVALLLIPFHALAEELKTSEVSISATGLPTLSANEQSRQVLHNGIRQELFFRRVLEQQAGATEFADVKPEEWASQVLADLNNRYDCLKGFDNTYSEKQALSEDDLVAALSTCVQSVERFVLGVQRDSFHKEHWQIPLDQDIATTLLALKNRLDALAATITYIENTAQFLSLKGADVASLVDGHDVGTILGALDPVSLPSGLGSEVALPPGTILRDLAVVEEANELAKTQLPDGWTVVGGTTPAVNPEAVATSLPANISQVNNITAVYSQPLNETVSGSVFAGSGDWRNVIPTLNPDVGADVAGVSSLLAQNNPLQGGIGAALDIDLDLDLFESSFLSVGSSSESAVVVQSNFKLSDRFTVSLMYDHGQSIPGLGGQGLLESASSLDTTSSTYGFEVAWQSSNAIAFTSSFTYEDGESMAMLKAEMDL